MVESRLPKPLVAGSIPVSRSKFLPAKVPSAKIFMKTLLIGFSSMSATISAPIALPAQGGLHRSTGHWPVPSVPERPSGQAVASA